MKIQYAVAHCACGSGLIKPSTAAAAAAADGGGGHIQIRF